MTIPEVDRGGRGSEFTIRYRSVSKYVPVDVAQLRPKGSYKQLLKQRTHPIDHLVEQHGSVPPSLLQERACPTCESTESRHELDKDHLTLVRCTHCDIVYVNPIFDEAHYHETYGSTYYQRIVRDLGEASHDYRVRRFGTERVDATARHLGGPTDATPACLDVGAPGLSWRRRAISAGAPAALT